MHTSRSGYGGQDLFQVSDGFVVSGMTKCEAWFCWLWCLTQSALFDLLLQTVWSLFSKGKGCGFGIFVGGLFSRCSSHAMSLKCTFPKRSHLHSWDGREPLLRKKKKIISCQICCTEFPLTVLFFSPPTVFQWELERLLTLLHMHLLLPHWWLHSERWVYL